ncbi:MAG: hypothetical protein SFV21_11275 [Rhodospirillaceae bacterium]|nr:hypothetical protein [Rhodospirillaceae bacterium]
MTVTRLLGLLATACGIMLAGLAILLAALLPVGPLTGATMAGPAIWDMGLGAGLALGGVVLFAGTGSR